MIKYALGTLAIAVLLIAAAYCEFVSVMSHALAAGAWNLLKRIADKTDL